MNKIDDYKNVYNFICPPCNSAIKDGIGIISRGTYENIKRSKRKFMFTCDKCECKFTMKEKYVNRYLKSFPSDTDGLDPIIHICCPECDNVIHKKESDAVCDASVYKDNKVYEIRNNLASVLCILCVLSFLAGMVIALVGAVLNLTRTYDLISVCLIGFSLSVLCISSFVSPRE